MSLVLTPSQYAAMDAIALAEHIDGGDFTAAEILEVAIARCESLNPQINAVVIRLYDEARKLASGDLPMGRFRGVPFLIKDLALRLEGVPTTSGSRFFADAPPADHDSEMVARYKRAGLVIFGKSASPEFGLTTTTESVLHGVTHNPWNLGHTAGGSSGGAAAAVAAGILPFANASDGGGSIRIPASCCGLFGLKPSRGRMPMGPDLGEGWAGMSVQHAVTRTVRDSAALLDATQGPDIGAPYHAPPTARPYLEEVDTPPRKLRIALQTEAFNGAATHPDCVAAAKSAAALCQDLGHEVEEATLEVDYAQIGAATQTIINANLRVELAERVDELGREPGDEDLERFTRFMLEGTRDQTAAQYANAVRAIHAAGRQVATFLQPFDILVTPTLATPPLPIGALSLSRLDIGGLARNLMETSGYTQLFNVSGSPAASIPLHWNEAGLPIGVQFVAHYGEEAKLLRLAAQLEKARPWFHRRPEPA